MSVKRNSIIALLAVSALSLKAQNESIPTFKNDIVTNYLMFENDADVSNWKAENGKLSFSDLHYKDGKRSLQWDYSKQSALEIVALKGLTEAGNVYPGGVPEIYEPSFYQAGRYGGVKFWLYQEQPGTGTMIFQVGSSLQAAKTTPKYRFAVNLNFTGWRAVWVNFEEDAKVKNYKGSDVLTSLVVYPSKEVKQSGKLFIDHLTLLTFVSNKRNSDQQFANQKLNLRNGDGYEILGPYQDFVNFNYPKVADARHLSEESKLIADRLEFIILGDKTSDWKLRNTGIENIIDKNIKTAYATFDKLGIQTNGRFVNGQPLYSIRDEHVPKEASIYEEAMQPLAFPLAMDYRLNGNKEAKDKLLLTLDYLADQGWAAGSAIGTVDHVIKLNPVASGIFLARRELQALNKLQPQVEMLAWHTRLGSILNIDYTRGENSDKIRGGALAKLMAILMMDNNGRKQKMLQDFKAYMDYAIGISPGYSDTFKPDFSIYHHRGTYLNTYGTNAVNTMALIHWLLSGTAYQLAPQSTYNLNQALKRQADIAFGVEIHHGVGGRFPLNNSSIDRYTLPAFAYMSMTGNSVTDTAMAKLFNYFYQIAAPKNINAMLSPSLTYSGTFGTLDMMVRLHQSLGNNNVAKPADGATVMPFSGLMAYRKGDAFSTVKGYNKYVWDYETGRSQNLLGRYLSFGTLITAQGDPLKGFAGNGIDITDGFDWAYLPGATTKALPADKMLYAPKGDDKYIEGKHRNFSESVIASGLNQNGNGLFALDLRDDVFPDDDKSLFDNSFRAKKSYFFIGNEIICLGSNISNSDGRYPTVTTLFQYKFDDARSNYFDGKTIGNSLQLNEKQDGGYFTDQNGLHFVIPKGNQLVWQQSLQTSYAFGADEFDKSKNGYKKVERPFIKAWLAHGNKPANSGYEYEILLNTPVANVPQFINNPSYRVLQKDSVAHIIQHQELGITAYAIFEANKSISGPLMKTTAPLLAMYQLKNERVLLTVANPDIKQPKFNHNMSHMPDEITNGLNKGGIVSITLKGDWHLAKYNINVVNITYQNGNSIIEIYTKDGKSIDVDLQHRSADAGGER